MMTSTTSTRRRRHRRPSSTWRRRRTGIAVEQLGLVTGAVIGQWPSGRAASRHLQLSENFVGRVCRGLKDSAGGFRWWYVDESLGASKEAEEGEKVENEAEGEDEAEDEGEDELEDEGEDEAEDEDEDEE